MRSARLNRVFRRDPVGGSRPVTPITILGASSVVAWYRFDNVVLESGKVAALPDLGPNGYHGAQGTPGFQPTWVASSANFSGCPTAVFDGVDDVLDFIGMPFPAPGTENRQIRVICRLLTWTINRAFWGGGVTGIQQLFCNTASPNLALYNGGASIVGALNANITKRIRQLCTNSASDRLLIGATSTGAGTCGNISGTDWHLGSNGTAGSFCNLEVSEILITNRAVTAPEEAALQAYETPMYGASVYT